jgi:hypothetical protein
LRLGIGKIFLLLFLLDSIDAQFLQSVSSAIGKRGAGRGEVSSRQAARNPLLFRRLLKERLPKP